MYSSISQVLSEEIPQKLALLSERENCLAQAHNTKTTAELEHSTFRSQAW